MSRIGKKPVTVPQGVEVMLDLPFVTVKGSKGEVKREFHLDIDIIKNGDIISIKPKNNSGDVSNFWGLTRALLINMLKGVSEGFEKVLEFNGIGFKAAVKDKSLEMALGFSHPVIVEAPEGVEFKVEKNKITIRGIDKELVGQVAAKIRSYRPPEPYKGTGIFYQGETITRKAGKKAATVA